MENLIQRIGSLIWMFLCYFVFTLLNIGTDLSLSHNLIEGSKEESKNATEQNEFQKIQLLSSKGMFGCIVLLPVVLSFLFNIMKWFVFETSTTDIADHAIPTRIFSWIISPFYSLYLVLKILYKAMRGKASYQDDKDILEGEVGYHESGVQSMLQVTILGVVSFNALYSWVLRTLNIVTEKANITNTVGINGLLTVHDIHDNGLEILSEAGLPSTNLLIFVTYGTATISVVCGVMKFLCFSPQKMVHLKGCWEYLSTFLICLITPFIRKCFYGLCTFHLIVNIYTSLNPSKSMESPSVFDIVKESQQEFDNSTSNRSIPTFYSDPIGLNAKTLKDGNCSMSDSHKEEYLKAMEEHTWFYFYILMSSIVPTVLLTLVTLFVTTNFKHAIKAIFKFPIMIFEPLVMPFVFQGIEDIGLDNSMIKMQSKDVIEWKARSRTMTLSMWASDVNFLNIIIDGVFGCMFAALSTELEKLCIADMLERNAHFNILMWAGLGLKLLLHLLVLLVKIGCPETIMIPSYQSLGVLALEDGERVDTISTSEDIEFERGPGACRQCFGRFAASVAIILGVCGTLAISVAFFVFVYGGFGVVGIKGELSDLEQMWNDYGFLLSIPTLSLFIPVSLVVWCCLRANSKSYNTEFNTEKMPRGCFNCCLRQSTAAFFILVAAFSMILLPTGFVFAVVIAAQKEVKYGDDIKVNGYLMGAAMAAVMTIMVFTCLIPSCFYFLWYRGFRQGFAKSKQCWFNDLDKKRYNDQCNRIPKADSVRSTHNSSQHQITTGPMGGGSVNRIDSFHREPIGNSNLGLEMNQSPNSTGMTMQESHRNTPPRSIRSSSPQTKVDSPRLNHTRTMETVYENGSTEAMIPHNHSQHAPNAPPMTDSARESFSRQSYGDIPFIVQ